MKTNWLAEENQTRIVPSIEIGKVWVEEVTKELHATFKKMKEAKTNEEFRELTNQHYDLRAVKRHLQSQMGKLATFKFKSQQGGSNAV